MILVFDCGVTKENVAVPSMAIQAHIKECKNEGCIKDCERQLKIKSMSQYQDN